MVHTILRVFRAEEIASKTESLRGGDHGSHGVSARWSEECPYGSLLFAGDKSIKHNANMKSDARIIYSHCRN